MFDPEQRQAIIPVTYSARIDICPHPSQGDNKARMIPGGGIIRAFFEKRGGVLAEVTEAFKHQARLSRPFTGSNKRVWRSALPPSSEWPTDRAIFKASGRT